ncbi:MAG: hypothetical protein IK099_01475 [Clostridia bacterium]|nr:hypothetical protein [Clostridia bacterium]
METLVALARFFGIEITEGAALAQPGMIRLAQEMLGKDVPEPFYRGFPATVRGLTEDQLLFDQAVHYLRTYGLKDFSRPGHSLIEFNPEMGGRELIRAVVTELTGSAAGAGRLIPAGYPVRGRLNETAEKRPFAILPEEAALKKLQESVDGLFQSTRPLSILQTDLLCEFVREYRFIPQVCNCKETAIALMLATMDPDYARFLHLSDVTGLADALNAAAPFGPARKGPPDLKNLNLPNRSRRLLAKVIDQKFLEGCPNTRDCFAEQQVWCGLLHHIHYRPVNAAAEAFVRGIRSGVNQSPEAEFERLLLSDGPAAAARALRASRGAGAVIRRLDHLLCRCREEEEISAVLACAETDNTLLLIQLLLHCAAPNEGRRIFRFTCGHRLHVHEETRDEARTRRTHVPPETRARVSRLLEQRLARVLAGRLGRVYIDPDMRRIAVPLQETASMSGVGVLPKGSRLPVDLKKTVRGFAYWEGVDDIDLSVMGLDAQGEITEFSWRTMGREMGRRQEDMPSPILYSGDETSGFHGGSEYFDIDVAVFRREYPGIRYLVFCANVFSGTPFEDCDCRAGWMARADADSGEVYEPATVNTAFRVTGKGTFALLYAIDLDKEEFVWLNLLHRDTETVAGESSMAFVLSYFRVTDVFNVYRLFSMMASQVTDDPAQAEVIVTDRPLSLPAGAQVIHSWDQEKILAYLSEKKLPFSER